MAIAPRSKINIGDFKHQVELQRLSDSTDEMGFHKEEWSTIAKLRCKIDFDDRLIRETFKDDGIDTVSVKIITIRYFNGLTIKDRLVYKGDVYEIYSIYNINEEDRFLRIWARGVS